MIELLSRLFIQNQTDVKSGEVRKAYGVMMSVIGIIANLLLSFSKFAVGTISGSISVTADAFNNLTDAGTQIIALISFKLSAKPADRSHPFGHARLEYVASMIVSFLILLVGVELGKESIMKIVQPVASEFSALMLAVLALSVLVKLWMGIAGSRVAKKIDSPVIRVAALDSFSDVLATSAVLASALIGRFTSLNTDAYMGLAVAIMILVAGIKSLNETKNLILGSPPDPEVVKSILAMAGEYPDILDIHDMVVHHYGTGNIIATLHAEVDGEKDVFYIHDVIDKLERRLYAELGVQATIHMDPALANDGETLRLRALAAEAARAVDQRMSIHDCRYFSDEGGQKLIFDMVIPYECKQTNAALCAAVQEKIAKTEPGLLCEITVDRR